MKVLIPAWLLFVIAYAAWYVSVGLAAESSDLYARTVEFQLLAFALTRLPLLVAGLGVALALVVKRSTRRQAAS